MLTKKIFIYIILLSALFFSLIFITGQNKEYQEIKGLEDKLYKQIERQVVEHKENLYKIEKEKRDRDILALEGENTEIGIIDINQENTPVEKEQREKEGV